MVPCQKHKSQSWRNLHACFSERLRQRGIRVSPKGLQVWNNPHLAPYRSEETHPSQECHTKMSFRHRHSGFIDDEVDMAAGMTIIHYINTLAAIGQGLPGSIDGEDSDNPVGHIAGDEGIYDAPPKVTKRYSVHQRPDYNAISRSRMLASTVRRCLKRNPKRAKISRLRVCVPLYPALTELDHQTRLRQTTQLARRSVASLWNE